MAKPVRRRVVKSAAPTTMFDRIIDSLRPSHLKAYWFSRQGAQMLLKIVGVGFLIIFLVFIYFAKDLPNPSKVRQLTGAQNTKYYARDAVDSNGQIKIKSGQVDGTLLWEDHGAQNRTIIEFNQMPDSIKHATVAIEDKNFYKEGAFSIAGYLRAAYYDILHRGVYQGGSTITQQYVKNALLSNDRSITRKVKELILSIEIGASYKKDDILKLYLNEIPYGSQAYGIQAASKTFFKKDAKDLTLSESALFASMANAPTYYSPYGEHQQDLVDRQHLVLDLMAQQGYITQKEADDAKYTLASMVADVLPSPNTSSGNLAPQFNLYAKEVLEGKYGTATVESGGLNVVTTLDKDKQVLAEQAVDANMRSVRSAGGSNAALVSADPKTGQIFAMIGSYDFTKTPFNVALAGRQPGSSFKPIVYSTAWGKDYNYGPGTTIYDVTTDFGGGYKPKNYSGINYGIQSMRTALDGSLNIPAVKTLYLAGVPQAINMAHSLGITTLNNDPGSYGLSLVLGSGEVRLVDMVNAYESFANGGMHYTPTPILKVVDSKNNVLVDNTKPTGSKQALDPQVAYLMANVLSDNNARAYIFGINNPLTIAGHTVAAKTGTTTDFRDAWTMGFTPDIVTGVWVGNNDNTPMTAEAVDIAAPVWHTYMANALKSYPNSQFTKPSGIKQVTLDADTGRLPTSATRHSRNDIFASWYKPITATDTRSAKIDKVSGKLATDCTPPLAVDTVYSSEIHAEIPSTDPAYSRWDGPVQALAASLGYGKGGTLPTSNDDVHSCNDTKPTVSVTVTGSGPIHISANVASGTFPANKLEIKFDDQVISTQSPIANNPYQFDYDAPSTGTHTVTATVTDSGLYQASDQTTVTVTSNGGGTFVGTGPSSGSHQSGSVSFSWSDDQSSSYDLFITRNGAPYALANPKTTSNTSTNVLITQSGVYSWHVVSSNGNTSPNYGFFSP